MKGENMEKVIDVDPVESGTPEIFYTEMLSAFFNEARSKDHYAGDDLIMPELMQAGGDFSNTVLSDDEMFALYKGDFFCLLP